MFAHTLPSTAAFPELTAGQLLRCSFRGLLSVHFRYSLPTCRVAKTTLYTGGFSSFVTSTTAPIATGWNEPVPGRDFPRCGPAPFHGARKYVNNIVEQDHRRVKFRVSAMLGFKSFRNARAVLAGIELI